MSPSLTIQHYDFPSHPIRLSMRMFAIPASLSSISPYFFSCLRSRRDSDSDSICARPVICPASTPVGQQFNEQIACACSPLFSFGCNSVATEYTLPQSLTHVRTLAVMLTSAQGHTKRERQRERERLNHIISSQIINDIIFGRSLCNVGQIGRQR